MLCLYEQLLNHGYIRRIERLLNNKTIPYSIYDICFNFYRSQNTILYISTKINYGLHIAAFDNGLNWYSNINQKESSIHGCESYCYIENIKLPKKYHNYNQKQNMNAIVHFTSKSFHHHRHELILFNENQLQSNNHANSIDIKRLELPHTIEGMTDISECGLIYSKSHGIVCIGGDDMDSMYYLELIDNNNDWKWNDTLSHMNHKRSAASCTIINKNSNDEKYFIVGGYGPINDRTHNWLNSVELYECKTNKWILLPNAKYTRCWQGIYMDEMSNVIYLGGGNNNYSVNVIEYFDIVKNKWYEILAETEEHNKPIIWKNENLLYIASVHSDIQYIDLRMDNNKWNEQTLESVFGDSISDMEIKIYDNSNVLLNLKY
eukprot:510197_1